MDFLSFGFALTVSVLGIVFASQPSSLAWVAPIFPFATTWFLHVAFSPHSSARPSHVLKLGGVTWNEADFCRGWEIDGRTGSGKTASGVVPIIYALKCNRPEVGIMALDTKGDLSEPLEAIARELNRESDLRQLEVRPDDAPANWSPRYTLNMLADGSIPYSTYAKMLVDVATAAGQKGGQAFFKNAAQTAIQNAMASLAALGRPVTIDSCCRFVTDQLTYYKEYNGPVMQLKGSQHGYLVEYYQEFVKQPPEQKAGIVSTVFNYLSPYTAPDIAQIFCPADPTFDIEELDLGRLVTVKIPQKYQTEKKYISLLLKILFYLHALRRYDLPAAQREAKNLIVLALDEAQETVLVSEDGISDYNVVDKIRGARATTINSTQSPTSYIPPMGSREKADVFLLNLGNKIYFTAADKHSSEMLADSIGKRTFKKRTWGRSGGKSNVSWTEQDEHLIKPHLLRSLPKHMAIIKHCERSYKRVYLPPSRFTKPKPIAPKNLNESGS
jgi:Type IV secretory system Conjugative DNA transfer